MLLKNHSRLGDLNNINLFLSDLESGMSKINVKVKEESEKVGLKLNIQKASGSITSWQIDGETVETVANFICLVAKITADGD